MDKIITAYQTLFKNAIITGGAIEVIKKVYWWDPYSYPEDSCPCMYIEPSRSIYTPYLQYDRREHPLEIGVIWSVKDSMGAGGDDEVTFKQKLVDLVEGTEPSDSAVRWDTIVWLIQKNPCLNDASGTYHVSNEVTNVQVNYQRVQGKGAILYIAKVNWTVLATWAR